MELDTRALEVSVGDVHTCALLEDGGIACWGLGLSGQRGDGSTERSSLPVQVLDLDNAVHIGLGSYHSCAIDAQGAVLCWGDSRDHELGDFPEDHSAVPVVVIPPSD